MEWQTGQPAEHGYYLAAWRSGDRWIVSELWFNPASVGGAFTGWWTTRGYLGGRTGGTSGAMLVPVEAWTPMPVYEPELAAAALAEDAADAAAARSARASIEAGEPVVSWESVKDEAGL